MGIYIIAFGLNLVALTLDATACELQVCLVVDFCYGFKREVSHKLAVISKPKNVCLSAETTK